MQPKNPDELAAMLRMAMELKTPVFLRYNSAYSYSTEGIADNIAPGHSEILKSGKEICLLAIGHFVDIAYEVDAILGGDCAIVNVCSIKPLDGDMLLAVARKYRTVVTMEDSALAGGFGSAVLEFYCDSGVETRVIRIGWPDKFIEHGSSEETIRQDYHLDATSIARRIRGELTPISAS
jgi:1-deoxy-D-xylulose-5-phosphate synthase